MSEVGILLVFWVVGIFVSLVIMGLCVDPDEFNNFDEYIGYIFIAVFWPVVLAFILLIAMFFIPYYLGYGIKKLSIMIYNKIKER